MPDACTQHFGVLPYQEDEVLLFPDGLPGFENERSFLLVQQPATRPLLFLQSLSRPDLCFISLPILVVDPGYQTSITPEDLARLDLPVDRQPRIGPDVLCLALISIRENEFPTANLLAPVVVNLRARKAVQAIQEIGYSHQFPVGAVAGEATCL